MAQTTRRTGRTDSDDLSLGKDQSFIIPASGPIDRGDFKDEFETVDTNNFAELMQAEAFAQEIVTVKIQQTDNPTAEKLIQVSVNGVNQFLIRGVETKIKRMFLEVLARCKGETITTEEYIDPNGNRATRVLKHRGLRYPFEVVDDSQEGRQWLRRVAMEA